VRGKEGEQHITFYNLLVAQMKETMGGMEPWNKPMTLGPNTQPRKMQPSKKPMSPPRR